MSKYLVLSNLNHNGTLYEKDSEIELDDTTAKQLVNDKVIRAFGGKGVKADEHEPTKAEKEAEKQAKKTAEASERAQREAEEGAEKTDAQPESDGLEDMTKEDLAKLAKKEKIEHVTTSMNKDDMIEAIRTARKGGEGEENADEEESEDDL